ncbi:hypothetical protein QM359_06535 [Streptococcus infantis]|jgi:hypothetical protein|uniref:hypothetical protein n=1 Tax=Streptococcus infantis TaxID=68892 RepID=UPI0039C2A678
MSSAKQANWNLGCSLLLTVVLVGGVLFYFRVKNTYNYILQPGQSVTIRVLLNTDQLEYSSELILKKKDSQKIKLSGMTVWSEQFSDVLFEVEGHKVVKIGDTENGSKELPNNQQNIQLVEDGIEVTYLGEKVFDVTNNKKFTITITNVDDKPAHFEAQVLNR